METSQAVQRDCNQVEAELLARAASLQPTGSDKEQLARLNQWLEVALNNMARGLSMFDTEQRLILCNDIYRDIYCLPADLAQPGTPLADIVRHHVRQETGLDDPDTHKAQLRWITQHLDRAHSL